MLDIGWTEIAVIVVVAIVVIGPKDLPLVLKTVGTWVRKARMLTREFQGHVDDMIREAELEDVRRQALELKNMNLARQVEKTIDPTGSLRTAFDPDADGRQDAVHKPEGAGPENSIAQTNESAPPSGAPAAKPAVPAAEPAKSAEPAPSVPGEPVKPEKRA